MRDVEALRDQLLRLGPWWLRDPEEVMDAVLRAAAAQLSQVEGAIETLHDRTLIGRADASWLDEHGVERTRYRAPGESDDLYRERIRAWPDAVTKPAILAAVNAVLVVGEARIEEWLPDGTFLCGTGSGKTKSFLGNTVLFGQRRGFTVYIPHQAPATHDTFFVASATSSSPRGFLVLDTGDGHSPEDRGSFLDNALETPSGVYARVMQVLRSTKAAGIEFRVIVE
jgi:hypothetical protein